MSLEPVILNEVKKLQKGSGGSDVAVGNIITDARSVDSSGYPLLKCDGKLAESGDYPQLRKLLDDSSLGEVWMDVGGASGSFNSNAAGDFVIGEGLAVGAASSNMFFVHMHLNTGKAITNGSNGAFQRGINIDLSGATPAVSVGSRVNNLGPSISKYDRNGSLLYTHTWPRSYNYYVTSCSSWGTRTVGFSSSGSDMYYNRVGSSDLTHTGMLGASSACPIAIGPSHITYITTDSKVRSSPTNDQLSSGMFAIKGNSPHTYANNVAYSKLYYDKNDRLWLTTVRDSVLKYSDDHGASWKIAHKATEPNVSIFATGDGLAAIEYNFNQGGYIKTYNSSGDLTNTIPTSYEGRTPLYFGSVDRVNGPTKAFYYSKHMTGTRSNFHYSMSNIAQFVKPQFNTTGSPLGNWYRIRGDKGAPAE